MALDGFYMSGIVRELKETLLGGKVEKVYQPNKEDVVLLIHNKKKYKLFISVNSQFSRIHLTDESPENPKVPPNFCMLLRKHLQSGRISDIHQINQERMVEITFSSKTELFDWEEKKLIIEIMGKHSNISLVNPSTNRVIDSIKRISREVNRYRQLYPGCDYIYPPSQDKKPITEFNGLSFMEALKESEQEKSLVNFMVQKVQGLSKLSAMCIVSSLVKTEDFSKYTVGGFLNDESIRQESLFEHTQAIDTAITSGTIQYYNYMNEAGKSIGFSFFETVKPAILPGIKSVVSYKSPGQALDAFSENRATKGVENQKRMALQRLIEQQVLKLNHKREKLIEEIETASQADQYKIKGELLLAYGHGIEAGSEKVQVLNYYTNEQEEIPLDSRYSASKNSQIYYKKYNKLQRSEQEKKYQLSETEKEIYYLESVLVSLSYLEKEDEIEEIRQELMELDYVRYRKSTHKSSAKQEPRKPLSVVSSEGYVIMIGRNNKENDQLTLKIANKNDLWLHTKDIPGSHVIVRSKGGDSIPRKTILEAASMAAYYSKAKQSENVPVDYTLVKHVKKPSGAKAGMVNYVDHKTVYVNPKGAN